MDTEPLPTLPLRLLDGEKGFARSDKESGKKGDLLMKRVPFVTKLHFLRIFPQMKQPHIQDIFPFEEILEKVASLHRPLETYPGMRLKK